MPDPKPTSERARSGDIPPPKPRWGFAKGLITGAALEIPILTATLWLLARTGVGDADAPFMHIMRLTTVFAGFAALLTAGGIGRLAAEAAVVGGRRRAMWVSARAHVAASTGLVLIAAIPLGHLPAGGSAMWLAYLGAGIVSGVACGAMIGFICGGLTPVGFAEVWWLAKRPTKALRHLLGPEDLVRLGAAVRDRTSTLFEGMFEPAPLPPAAKPVDPALAEGVAIETAAPPVEERKAE